MLPKAMPKGINHKSPIAQWLDHPAGIWKVKGLTPVGSSGNSFSEYFDLEMLHYFHFIQGTNPFISYKIVSFTFFAEYFDLEMLHYFHFIQGTNPFISYKIVSFTFFADD